MRNIWTIARLEIKTVWRLPFTPATMALSAALVLLSAAMAPNSAIDSLAGEWTVWARTAGPLWQIGMAVFCIYLGSVRIAELKKDDRWHSLLAMPVKRWKIIAGMCIGRMVLGIGFLVPVMLGVGVLHADPALAMSATPTTAVQVATVGVASILAMAYLVSASFLNAVLFPRSWMAAAFSTVAVGAWMALAWVFPYTGDATVDHWLFTAQLGLSPFWLCRLTALGVVPIAAAIGATLGVIAHFAMAVHGEAFVNFRYDFERGNMRYHWAIGPLALHLAVGFGLMIAAALALGIGVGMAGVDLTVAGITKPGPRATQMRSFDAYTDPISRLEGPLVAMYFDGLARQMSSERKSRWRPAAFMQNAEGVLFDAYPGKPPVGIDLYGPHGFPISTAQIVNWQRQSDPNTPAELLDKAEKWTVPLGHPTQMLAQFEAMGLALVDREAGEHSRAPRQRIFVAGNDASATGFGWNALLAPEGYEINILIEGQWALPPDRRSSDVLIVAPNRWEFSPEQVAAIAQFRKDGGAVFVMLPTRAGVNAVPQTQVNGEPVPLMAGGNLPLPDAPLVGLLREWGLNVAPADWFCEPFMLPQRSRLDALGNRHWFADTALQILKAPTSGGNVGVSVAVREFAMAPVDESATIAGAEGAGERASSANPWTPQVFVPRGHSVMLRVPVTNVPLDVWPVAVWFQPGTVELGPVAVSVVEPFVVRTDGAATFIGDDERDVVANVLARLAGRAEDAHTQRRKRLVPNVPGAGYDAGFGEAYQLAAVLVALFAMGISVNRWRSRIDR